MNAAVIIRGLRKTFVSGWPGRKKEVLKGIDLTVPEGAFWGILGPNGAGKTTLLSILSNLLIPEEGEVLVLGRNILVEAGEIHRRMNLSSGHANFLWSMTVKENLEYYAMLYGLSGKARRLKIDFLIGLFDLTSFARERFDELSTGTKQKLSLAKSLLNDPQLLLLDEPTVGLDPDVARRVRESIKQIHREKAMTILMTTHNMQEAEDLCEEVAFIREGVIKARGKPEELKRGLGLGDRIVLSTTGALPITDLEKMEGVYHVQAGDSFCSIVVDDHRARVPGIIGLLLNRGVVVRELRVKESDLEDVFIAFAR
jgi:ABC-2 type transport system ATP-binding protein